MFGFTTWASVKMPLLELFPIEKAILWHSGHRQGISPVAHVKEKFQCINASMLRGPLKAYSVEPVR